MGFMWFELGFSSKKDFVVMSLRCFEFHVVNYLMNFSFI